MVYVLTPATTVDLDFDMYGSAYDTKIWIWDTDYELIACNDDYYDDYTSRLEDVHLLADTTYWVVIDGYGGDAGDYILDISFHNPCVIDCPAGAELEGEPPLVPGYMDAFNGGCQYPEFGYPMSEITQSVFCGVAGWYDLSRDTDWFEIVIPDGGVFEVLGDAEKPTYLFELGPMNCDDVGVIQYVTIGPCTEAMMTIAGEPGSTIWFWVGPTDFGPGYVVEYDFVLYTNLVVAVERHSFSEVKALFE